MRWMRRCDGGVSEDAVTVEGREDAPGDQLQVGEE
jgi:hypothetical protein